MSRITKAAPDKEISEEKYKELVFNANGILCGLRRDMLSRYPFFGQVAMSLNIVPVRDSRCPTAATDGENLFFNIGFLAELKAEDRMFVFMHECLHNVMFHFLRTETRDRLLFNLATDMEVNQILEKEGFIPPKECVMPELYGFSKNRSAEEYYELLQKRAEQRSKSNAKNSGSGSGDGECDTDANNSEATAQGCGNTDGQLSGQFDKHIYKGDLNDCDAESNQTSDKWGKVGHDPNFQPKINENTATRMAETLISAAQNTERLCGTVPNSMKSIINKLLNPEINWKDQLANYITKAVGDRACWARPNRRYIGSNVYLPSFDGDKVRCGIIIDTSGSTNSDMSQFLGELNGIVKGFGNYELTVVQCDAEVQSVEFYDLDNPLELETCNYERKGNGGTRLTPAFNKIRELEADRDIDCVIVFTDACTEVFKPDICDVPTLWVLTPDAPEKPDTITFGDICKFKSNKNSKR